MANLSIRKKSPKRAILMVPVQSRERRWMEWYRELKEDTCSNIDRAITLYVFTCGPNHGL